MHGEIVDASDPKRNGCFIGKIVLDEEKEGRRRKECPQPLLGQPWPHVKCTYGSTAGKKMHIPLRCSLHLHI